MNLLIGFIPFAAFAVVQAVAGLPAALAVAMAASLVIVGNDLFRGRAPRWLELGAATIFGVLGLYALQFAPHWSILQVHLYVHAGLLLVVLLSLVAKRPFTMAYAKERTSSEVWARPEFYKVNRAITSVWALAFSVSVAAQACLVWLPQVPRALAVAAGLAALVTATKYTMKQSNRAPSRPELAKEAA